MFETMMNNVDTISMAMPMEDKLKKSMKEKRNVMFVIAIVGFVIALATLIMVFRLKNFYNDEVCFTSECAESSLFLLDLIDITKDPCNDFTNFACAHHVEKATMDYAQKKISSDVRRFITGPDKPSDSVGVKLQKKYYRVCKDVETIENESNKKLRRVFQQLGGWPFLEKHWNASAFDWKEIMIQCKNKGLKYDWFIAIDRDATPERDLLIKPPSAVNIDFLLMANVMKILGATVNLDDIATKIQQVSEFADNLTKIVESSTTSIIEHQYRFMEFKNKFPKIDWDKLLEHGNLTNESIIWSKIDDYMPKLHKLIAATPKRVQADYIFWKLTRSLFPFLSLDVRKEFEIFEHLVGIKDDIARPELCYRMTRAVFPYVSEAAYARKFTKERDEAQGIIERIQTTIKKHIDNVNWINTTDKQIAKDIIDSMKIFVGAPQELYNISFEKHLGLNQINICNMTNPLDIVMEVNKWKNSFKLGPEKTILRNEMFYSYITDIRSIRYLYDNKKHFLIVPSAALEGLLFSKERSNFLKYGLLGTIIARKFTRSIMKYRSDNVSECIFMECQKDDLIINNSTFHCDSEIEEYFIDYMGLNVAYEAYTQLEDHQEDRLPGIPYRSKQVFWISHAATMCNNYDNDRTDKRIGLRKISISRILSSLKNSEYFANDFNCAIGSEINPKSKCNL